MKKTSTLNEEGHFYAAQEDDLSLPDMGDPEWEERYATYLDARRRFADLKKQTVASTLSLP